MRINALLALVSLWALPAPAQDHLSAYLDTGLKNNLILKDRKLGLEQSLLALKTARSYFLPSVALNADYLSAQGGRIISLPTGELLNPVYTSLNQLTATQKFQPIADMNEQLLPNDFYDARLHITYPLLNTDLYYNRKIGEKNVRLQEYEIDIYRQDLIRDIKQAFFGYCSAKKTIAVYEEALTLVQENLRTSQSLLKNGRGLPANVLRIESERQNITARIIESENRRINARNYLNFLLNRPMEDSVESDEPQPAGPHPAESQPGEQPATPDIRQRDEIKKLDASIESNNIRLAMDRHYYLPKINTFLDLGSQASDFQFNSSTRYYYVGAQLTMPLFTGGRNLHKIKQTQLDLQSLQLQKDLLTQRLQLATAMAQNNVRSAQAACEATEKELDAAKAYYTLMSRGYSEGVNSLIEFMDARNQLTTAALQLNIDRYNLLTQIAEYQRQTAVSKLN